MQGDELGDGVDVGGRVAQRLHPLARHPRADDVVVVERRALARLVATRARLADVVEQRGQAGDAEVEGGRAVGDGRRADVLDDGDRVAEHVLVAVDRVVLEAQRRQLGQELLGQPGVDAGTTGRLPGRSTTISLSSSSRMRSADTIASRCGAGGDGGDQPGDPARGRSGR